MKIEIKKFVSYIRVSSKRQGVSGLGLEDQTEVIVNRIKEFRGQLVKTFTEIETGTNKKIRPELMQAIAYCERNGCTLIVSRLDRLSRNNSFLSAILDSKLDVHFCDQPNADKTILRMLSIFAQNEAENIQKNTKRAIQQKIKKNKVIQDELKLELEKLDPNQDAAKVKYIKSKISKLNWGNAKNFTKHTRALGRQSQIKSALLNPNNKKAYTVAKLLLKDGKSLREIAIFLNETDYKTSRGGKFHASTISNIIKRYEANPEYI